MYQPIMYTASNPGTSLLGFLGKIKWSSIFSGTQKVLNFANQAIPLYYNVKPIIKNLKTITKIGKQLNNSSVTSASNTLKQSINETNNSFVPNPNFFI